MNIERCEAGPRYDIELRGAIELAAEAVANVLVEMTSKDAGRSLQGTPEDRAAMAKVGKTCFTKR